MITFRNQKTSATPNGIQLLHLAHHQAERTGSAEDFSQATQGSGFATPALVPGCHLPTASRRAPTELWEIAKVTTCIFTSEWPQVSTMGVFKASQTLQ